MNLACMWCGAFRDLHLAQVHHPLPRSVCGARSPFEPHKTCRRERGHEGRCTTERPTEETYLCGRCWRVWTETGERPPRYRMRDPQAGPITGRPLRLG